MKFSQSRLGMKKILPGVKTPQKLLPTEYPELPSPIMKSQLITGIDTRILSFPPWIITKELLITQVQNS